MTDDPAVVDAAQLDVGDRDNVAAYPHLKPSDPGTDSWPAGDHQDSRPAVIGLVGLLHRYRRGVVDDQPPGSRLMTCPAADAQLLGQPESVVVAAPAIGERHPVLAVETPDVARCERTGRSSGSIVSGVAFSHFRSLTCSIIVASLQLSVHPGGTGEGTIFDKWEEAGRRAMQRDQARRAR